MFLSGCQKAYFQKCLSLREKSMTAIFNLKSATAAEIKPCLFGRNNRKKYSIYVKNQELYI